MTFGKRGTFVNAGIPGLGLYSRQRISPPPSRTPSSEGDAASIEQRAQARIGDDGRLTWTTPDGSPLPPEWEAIARKQQRSTILTFLKENADERNDAIEALGRLHEHCPDPRVPPSYIAKEFDESPPLLPPPRSYSLLDRLSSERRARVDAENEGAQTTHAAAVAAYSERKRAHDSTQRGRKLLYERLVLTDLRAMDTVLEERLQFINWPRETLVAFDIGNDGSVLYADVDLPEIEDMPTETYAVASRDLALVTKEMSEKRVRELYLRHVHSVGLRVAGEIIAGLPKCETLYVSGFSQRPNKATGQIEDQYLYSSRIERAQWLRLNFDEPARISAVDAFDTFETRREVTKTGVFRPITPFAKA
jgi:hypothetical protein